MVNSCWLYSTLIASIYLAQIMTPLGLTVKVFFPVQNHNKLAGNFENKSHHFYEEQKNIVASGVVLMVGRGKRLCY